MDNPVIKRTAAENLYKLQLAGKLSSENINVLIDAKTEDAAKRETLRNLLSAVETKHGENERALDKVFKKVAMYVEDHPF